MSESPVRPYCAVVQSTPRFVDEIGDKVFLLILLTAAGLRSWWARLLGWDKSQVHIQVLGLHVVRETGGCKALLWSAGADTALRASDAPAPPPTWWSGEDVRSLIAGGGFEGHCRTCRSWMSEDGLCGTCIAGRRGAPDPECKHYLDGCAVWSARPYAPQRPLPDALPGMAPTRPAISPYAASRARRSAVEFRGLVPPGVRLADELHAGRHVVLEVYVAGVPAVDGGEG